MKNTIKAYLADDHAMLREGLVALAAREGDIEIVGQTGNGLDVMADVSRLKPDVAVVDISMPGLNGLDVCRELTRNGNGTAVLILTMQSQEEFVIEALRNGASGYLIKDAAIEQFCKAVRAVAGGEVYLSPGISRGVFSRVRDWGEDPYDRLTTRERQVLHMIVEGMTNPQIAETLGIAVKTVGAHRTNLMRKLDIHDQTSLVKFAIRRGIIHINPSPNAPPTPDP